MPNFRQRKWLFIAIAIAIIIILTLIAAPNSGGRKSQNGSTYGRSADGYGAWYAYMTEKNMPIERWRKPFSQFIKDDFQDVTYIRILNNSDHFSSYSYIFDFESDWVSQGNTLVIIGKHEPATAAPFESLIPYRQSTLSTKKIKVATSRRLPLTEREPNLSILQDDYGAVVWQEKVGQGQIIYCTTPYLAANAYQDYPDNFQFLQDLVDDRQDIWVDEYIHGYKDQETITQEQQEDLFSYLTKTPWYFIFIQTVLMIAVATITTLRRFGLPFKPKTVVTDNSTAYIDALAGVLEKANSTDFVVEAISKDEQRKLQKSLGLGKSLVDQQTLITAYTQQRPETSTDIEQLLRVSNQQQKISNAQLIACIEKWQKINSNP